MTSFPLEVIRGPDPDFFSSCSSNFLALRQEKRVSITESSFGKLEIGVVLHFSYGSNPICTVSNSMPGMMRFRAELNRDYVQDQRTGLILGWDHYLDLKAMIQ